MTRRVSAYERAMRQVIKTETCWLWPGQKTGNGYGLVSDWHPDGRRWKAVACPYGHPYDDVNTMVDGRGFRVCRTCNREKCRARYWARKSEQVAVGRSMMVGEREADRVHAASST